MGGVFILLKDIAEAGLKVGYGSPAAVGRDHPVMQKMETAQVVDTVDMVGMVMGKKQGINGRDSLTQQLQAEIRAAVDQYESVLIPDQQ